MWKAPPVLRPRNSDAVTIVVSVAARASSWSRISSHAVRTSIASWWCARRNITPRFPWWKTTSWSSITSPTSRKCRPWATSTSAVYRTCCPAWKPLSWTSARPVTACSTPVRSTGTPRVSKASRAASSWRSSDRTQGSPPDFSGHARRPLPGARAVRRHDRREPQALRTRT